MIQACSRYYQSYFLFYEAGKLGSSGFSKHKHAAGFMEGGTPEPPNSLHRCSNCISACRTTEGKCGNVTRWCEAAELQQMETRPLMIPAPQS